MNRNLLKKILIISGIVLILVGGIVFIIEENTDWLYMHYLLCGIFTYSTVYNMFGINALITVIGTLLMCIGLLIKDTKDVKKIKENQQKYKMRYIILLTLGLIYFLFNTVIFIFSGIGIISTIGIIALLIINFGTFTISIIFLIKGILGLKMLEKIKKEDETEEKMKNKTR